MIRSALCAGAAALLAAACGTPATPLAGSGTPASDDPQRVADANETFRTALSLPFRQSTDDRGVHEIEVPLEGSAPIYCYVWPEETSLGVAALRATDRVFDELAQRGRVSDRALARVESGAIAATAYQTFAWSFQLATEETAGRGLMKTAAANPHGHGMLCNHWPAGRQEVFDRVVRELLASFRSLRPGPRPHYEQIERIRVDGRDVGINATTYTRDAEGDVLAVAQSSLVRLGPGGIRDASYKRRTEWSDPTGDLINAYYVVVGPAGTRANLSLRWEPEDGWRVSGAYEESEVEDAFAGDEPLDGMLAHQLAYRSGLRPEGDRERMILERWMPDALVTRRVATRLSVDPDDPDVVLQEWQDFQMRVSRDDRGLPLDGRIETNGHTLEVERLHRGGDL